MKLSELKQIIRECICELELNEKAPHRPKIVSGRAKDLVRVNTQDNNRTYVSAGEKVSGNSIVTKGKRRGKLTKAYIKKKKDDYNTSKYYRDLEKSGYVTPTGHYFDIKGNYVNSSPRKSTYKKSKVGK